MDVEVGDEDDNEDEGQGRVQSGDDGDDDDAVDHVEDEAVHDETGHDVLDDRRRRRRCSSDNVEVVADNASVDAEFLCDCSWGLDIGALELLCATISMMLL